MFSIKSKSTFTIRLIVHSLCLVPMSIIAWLVLNDQAGANPIEFLTRGTGEWTLHLLLITLTVRPLAQILKYPVLLSYRRAIGLHSFFYVTVHLFTYLWLDQFFDWAEIINDIPERPFILAGFSAFVLLVPLAATSTKWAIVALGHRWTILHRLVYVATATGLLHYWWLVRADYARAWIYLVILSLLLTYRLWRHFYFQRLLSH
ncbi:MAG: sulfite oxidase heme-binding subunit YedZ [Candidatus Oxydemutatoraceae bacterium WSBS_2016_MAG_OTU14]